MKNSLTLSVLIFLVLCLSCYKNPIERNTIVFSDSDNVVQDSLIKMERLLNYLPESSDGFNTNFYFKDQDFYINGVYAGNEHSIRPDTIKALAKFNIKDKKDFFSLAKFLRKNHFSSGFFDQSLNKWCYHYREIPDEDFNDARVIILIKEYDSSFFAKSDYKILDNKKKMFLIIPEEALLR